VKKKAKVHYPHIGRKETAITPAFWAKRYAEKTDQWDKGEPSPALVDFLREGNFHAGKIIVPGCGRGHDARALAKAGFEVLGVDVSVIPVRDATALAKRARLKNIRFEQADFFKLPTKFAGRFDWMFEHTFFCAIDPAMRDAYVEKAAELLRKNGWLLGVFYNIQPDSGPPFGCTREELFERFSPRFTLWHESVPRSFANREGKELLMLWQRR
jgi:ubiquinone/menaquinone biosynthesis C-methylase UbiE